MATTNAVSTNTYKAATDFAAGDLGKLVRISAADTVSIVDAVTQTPIGVLAEAPAKAGQAVPVARLQGIIKVRAGGAVTAGQLAVPAADGRVTGVCGHQLDSCRHNVRRRIQCRRGGGRAHRIERPAGWREYLGVRRESCPTFNHPVPTFTLTRR